MITVFSRKLGAELPFKDISYFFFNDTATTEIYTLSLHDALPISRGDTSPAGRAPPVALAGGRDRRPRPGARGERSEEHTSELQSQSNLVCRLLLEKKKVFRERENVYKVLQ